MVSLRYILPLSEVSGARAARTGNKAATLGELLQAGFNVPDGFVLCVEAFERFCRAHGFSGSSDQQEVVGALLPDDVTDELLFAHRSMRDTRMAVRSSSVAEDLAANPFTGQYDTILGVHGPDALVRAVSSCWSSAFSHRLARHRSGTANGTVPPMAVVVQRLVDPDAAGVAFTTNPVTGGRDQVVINAVRGLGDRLASGLAQPDEWSVGAGRAEVGKAPECAIGADEAVRVADLAQRVASHYGVAQDIEWAIAAGELFLLQARPITAPPPPPIAPVAIPIEVPDGFWQRETSHFPRPNTPMLGGFLDAHNAAFRDMCATYGLLIEAVEMRDIGGWTYSRVVPLGGKDRPPPPAWLFPFLWRTLPSLRARIRACREAIRSDRHGRDIERWYSHWQPELRTRLGDLAGTDLGSMDDGALDEHLGEVEGFIHDCLRLHFLLHGAMLMVLGEFGFACRDLLGWGDQRVLALLCGLSSTSTEPSRRLAELARLADGNTDLLAMLDRLSAVSVSDVREADDEFAAAFDAYLRTFGCRALSGDFDDPTLAEQPELVLRLVGAQRQRGYDPDGDASAASAEREAALAEARGALAGRPADLAIFERTLERARRAYPVREDSEFFTISGPLGIGRLAALEVGRRLAARGQLDRVQDVFFLRMDEQRGAMRSPRPLLEVVTRRRGERAWVEAHPGPASYGRPPEGPPELGLLPAESRFAMEALQWVVIERILAPQENGQTQASRRTLIGIPAAQGTYTGTVRVIMAESEFDRIRPGDVLVCPITSPVWSVLFPSIGALITDTGGVLSHAAIIAREYRLPAVVGTGNATQLLADGDTVTVDGSSGSVYIQTPVS